MPFRREAGKPGATMIQLAVTDAIFAGTRKRLGSLPIPGQDLSGVSRANSTPLVLPWLSSTRPFA
jgi:hypothetical protein